MAQQINENIINQQEGFSIPSLAWKLEIKSLGLTFDISEKMKTEPGIVDSADYRENLTYLNEVSVKVNDDTGFLKQLETSGAYCEAYLSGYFNTDEGSNFPLVKYSGYVDFKKSKYDAILKECELAIVPFFGKSDRSALRLTRQYMDENGLRLYNCEIWITDAGIKDHILSNGVHEISVKNDEGYPYAKLDDGDWTALGSGFKTVLNSAEDVFGEYESVEVFYISFSFAAGQEISQKVIVTQEGNQYPETFFYYPTIREVVSKAYNEMDLTDLHIDRFLIPTFDGRRVMSGTSRVDNDQSNTFIPVAMVSNGTDKIYISGSTGATTSPFKNQIWEYNHVTNAIRLLYETTLNINTHYKLVWDDGHLIAFIDNKETDEERGFIQYFTFGEFGDVYSTVMSDDAFQFTNPYFRFHYSKFLKVFVYTGFTGGNKTITAVDLLTGAKTTLLTDNSIEITGFNCIWDYNTTVDFYFIKNHHGFAKRLYKISYVNGWQAPEQVCDWISNDNFINYYGYPFYFEGKIFIQNYERTDARFFDVASAEFTDNLCPDNTKIYSPTEIFERLYFIRYDTDDLEQRIAYFKNGTITNESFKKITPYDLVSNAGIFGFQLLTEFTDINDQQVIGALSKTPSLLLKFADTIEPFIEGELDTEGRLIRDVLQSIANNFLAHIKVDYNKKAWFVRRADYTSGDTITIKKDYVRQRIKQTVYNEIYDGVQIENANGVTFSWGNTGVTAKVLSLKLEFIPDDFVKDAAKYFYDYYSTARNIHTISYPPTFYNYETFDKVDLSELGLPEGRIHTMKPTKAFAEIGVLVNA